MISIKLRTLLLFNFGVALVFLLIAGLSTYSLDLVRPNRAREHAAFSGESKLAVVEEQSIDQLRSRALFYFDIARNIRLARMQDEVRVFNDAQFLSFAVAILFLASGILAILLPRPKED
jgi:hypothetical protein